MNGLDWILISFIILFTLYGFYQGFVRMLLSIAGTIAAFAAAFLFYDKLARWLGDWFPITNVESISDYEFFIRTLHLDSIVYHAIAFAILFFGTKIAVSIASYLLHWVTKLPVLSGFNRWLGGILGLIEAGLICLIVIYVMSMLPNDTIQSMVHESAVAEWGKNDLPFLWDYFRELWDKAID